MLNAQPNVSFTVTIPIRLYNALETLAMANNITSKSKAIQACIIRATALEQLNGYKSLNDTKKTKKTK